MTRLIDMLAGVPDRTLLRIVAGCFTGSAALLGVMAGMAISDDLPDAATVFIYLAVTVGLVGAVFIERTRQQVL
jgi:hypothetical protein